MGEIVEFPSNGATGQGYLATPSGGSGPGLIVIQEWWGLVDHIKEVCDRLAAEGFVALAPDLYRGESAGYTEPDEAQKLMMQMQIDEATKDMSGAVDFLLTKSSGDGVGVIGFCMGGAVALHLATKRGDAVKAVVPFYGVIGWLHPDWSGLGGPIQGHYAEHDDFASPDAVAELVKQVEADGKQIEIFTYPGTQHAFFNDSRPEVHDPSASKLAWDRALTFLRSNLS
jgi:carboxymethylenebutenolidase